jgi:predicted Zn-dependent protease
MGLAEVENVGRSMGVYDDPELTAYVSELGMRLARASERPELPWQFQIVDTPDVNAFALPGGPIYVTRGILAHMNSEAALVGVLGHEIGHTTSRHIVQKISQSQLAGLGYGLGMVFLPEVRPYGDLIQGGLQMLFLKFSRDDEREADTLGIRYSLGAGYDPTEMATFFQVLNRIGERSGQKVPNWLSTHPDPLDREERILSALQSSRVSRENLLVEEEEFKRRLEGMVYGEDPNQGFMDGSRFKHPELKFQIDFPPGWRVQNTPMAVFSAPSDGSAALQLTGAGVPAGTRPEDFGRSWLRQNRLEYGTGERGRVHGFPTYVAPFRAVSDRGTVVGEAGFIIDGEVAYQVLAYTSERAYRQYRETFLQVVTSFDRLRDREALTAQPERIRIYRVPRPMTLERALADSGIDRERMAELALVNNMELDDRLETGTLIKTLKGGRGRKL